MKPNDMLALLEKIAPVSLSDEFCKKYGMYDNSGIIINCGEEIRGALFTLELSRKAVEEAKANGFNIIVTHHPAIYGGINRFDIEDDPQAAALADCIKNGISVISMHLNFDAAPEGIDFNLMRGLGGENAEKIYMPVTGGGYGRVYAVKPQSFKTYADCCAKEFSSARVLAYGDKARQVKKVASFCGAGCNEKAIAFAKLNGADVFVSSDMKHHEILALLEAGINVLHMTHYAAENYGFEKIYLKLEKQLKVPSKYFTYTELL